MFINIVVMFVNSILELDLGVTQTSKLIQQSLVMSAHLSCSFM